MRSAVPVPSFVDDPYQRERRHYPPTPHGVIAFAGSPARREQAGAISPGVPDNLDGAVVGPSILAETDSPVEHQGTTQAACSHVERSGRTLILIRCSQGRGHSAAAMSRLRLPGLRRSAT